MNNQYKIDERNHVEVPLLEQLKGLGWKIIDLTDEVQSPTKSYRNSYSEVVLIPILREQLKVINPWIEEDQIDEVVRKITTNFTGSSLVQINQQVLKYLLENTTVSENRKTGEKSPSVHFIDFKTTEKNQFTAICQFKVRIIGTDHHIIPDVVLFLNGLPVVVIECKSPKEKDAIPQAIDQCMRYCEQRGARGEGSQPLFYYNQFIIVTCKLNAKFGTITTHNEKHFYKWSDPYPLTLNDLEHKLSSPNDQQRLVAGMLAKRNLLDIIHTFTIFSTNDKGEVIKVVGRYQQFRAVKLSVKRLLEGKNPRERSGIVWHTQGSGKSLTMMFMVREMYKHSQLANWKVIFITDRTQLEAQLSETSQSVGYSINVASSIKKLKELVRTESSDLIMAMIHKFRDTDLKETFPILNTSPNILIMTDEAHRSQYKQLGANLDKAIPNASRIGYTGTPIDKTEKLFGDYIDKYTMRQAIEDGVTLEIVYEGRTHKAEIKNKEGMDSAFEDIFSDYNIKERLEILGHGSKEAYLEAKSTIKAKAFDMVDHYLNYVFPNKFKAQVVASSRAAATRYKRYIDFRIKAKLKEFEKSNPNRVDLEILKKFKTDVIISGSHNDKLYLKRYSDSSLHEKSIKSFKMSFDGVEKDVSGDTGILIVNNMLIVGFDAPIEQVLYLDRIITDHNLLQAIARVNRVASKDKEKGFVVDYIGIGNNLKKALDNYDERERKEIVDALSSPDEELKNLKASHAKIIELLKENGLTDFSDIDAFFDLCYDEEFRFAFLEAFKDFTRCLNLLYPSKHSLDYLDDYNAMVEMKELVGKHLRDKRISMVGIPSKLRIITDRYLESKGINLKIAPISILDEDFQKNIKNRKKTKSKAAEVEYAIRDYIEMELDDPDLQASFAQALEDIIKNFAENWDRIFKELEQLREKIKEAQREPTYGLDRKKQMPFFRSLKKEIFGEKELNEEEVSQIVGLTQNIYICIEREIQLVSFWESLPARNRLKSELNLLLLESELISVNKEKRERLLSRLMEIAEKNTDTILY